MKDVFLFRTCPHDDTTYSIDRNPDIVGFESDTCTHTFTIRKCELAVDDGVYTCWAANEYGKNKREFHVEISVRPRIVDATRDICCSLKENDIILLVECDGYPIPTPHWFFTKVSNLYEPLSLGVKTPLDPEKQDEYIKIESNGPIHKLILKEVLLDHVGLYELTLSNKGGEITHRIPLSIKGK